MQIKLNRPQTEIQRVIHRDRTLVLPWGRGVGKSFFERFCWWQFIAKYDGVHRSQLLRDFLGEDHKIEPPDDLYGVRCVLLMPSRAHCVDVHGALTEKENAETYGFLGGRLNRSRWRISFPGGSWLQFFGTGNANSARGLRVDLVVLDEGDDIEPDVVDSIVEPWFSEPWSMAIKIIGGTPRRGRYGLLYRNHRAGLSKEKVHANTFTRHATFRDAPENVNVERIERIKADMNPAVFKREYECDFDATEGIVYSHFDENFHVREPPPNTLFTEILIGADHGWEDPAVFLVIGLCGTGRDAVAWILEEFYETHASLDKKVAWLIKTSKRYGAFPRRYYGDPSRPDMLNEYKVRAHIPMLPANNALQDGIEFVGNMISIRAEYSETLVDSTGKPAVLRRWSKLYVHPRCKKTREEFIKYKRRPKKDDADAYTDDVIDKWNHCFVAGTLVATDDGDVPIERVAPGMKVRTREGFRRVIAAGMTQPSASIWRLELTDGRILDGTPDHPIWVEGKGWIRLDALRYGDILLGWQSSAEKAALRTASELCSTARHSGDIQTPRAASCASISSHNEDTGFTKPSGNITTGQSHRGIMFTTEMAILSTMIWTIWNAFPHESTPLLITQSSGGNGPRSTWTASDILRPNGIGARKGELGTVKMLEKRTQAVSRCRDNAINADKALKASRDVPTTDFAPTLAKALGDGAQDSTTNREVVLHAAPISLQTNTPKDEPAPASVARVYALDQHAPVFDLTVEGVHEFFANGILVHNCMDAMRYALMTRLGRPPADRRDLPDDLVA